MRPSCIRFAYMSGFALVVAAQGCSGEANAGEEDHVLDAGRDAQARLDADAQRDGGKMDAGSFGEAGEGGLPTAPASPCFDPASVASCDTFTSSAPSSRPKYGELLSAASLGDGARFVAIGGLAALARLPVDSGPEWVVAALGIDRQTPDVTIRELRPARDAAGGHYTVVDVWGQPASDPVLEADVFALACRMGSCTILAARRQEEETLTPLVEVELDAGIESELRGLVVDSDRICVFGDGLYCHDENGWREALSAAEAPGLRDVSLGDPDVAVGEAGLVQVNGGGGWQRVDVAALTEHTFERVDTQSGDVTILSDDGALVSGTPEALSSCHLQSGRLVLADAHTSGAPGIQRAVMDETGSIFVDSWNVHSQMREWCFRAAVPLESPVVGYASGTCGISTNLLLLTEQRLFSLFGETLMCAIAG